MTTVRGGVRPSRVLAGVLVFALACEPDELAGPGDDGPVVALGDATAFGIWTPGALDTCSKEQHDAYTTAYRLLRVLDHFVTLYPDTVPPTSILREFIGGSGFRY